MKKVFVLFLLLFLFTSNMFALRSVSDPAPIPPPPWIQGMCSGGSAGIAEFLGNPLSPRTHMVWVIYWLNHHYNS